MERFSDFVLHNIFSKFGGYEELLTVSKVCKSWRSVSIKNRLWIPFLKDKIITTEIQHANDLLNELEDHQKKKKEQIKCEYQLQQEIYKLDERIGLLIEHKKKIDKSPRCHQSMKYSRSEAYLSTSLSVEHCPDSEVQALRKRMEIVQAIVCIFRFIGENDSVVENIHNSYGVFSFLHKTQVKQWPKFLLNADHIFAFVKTCDHKRVESNDGFCRMIVLEVMQFVEHCKLRHSWSCGELTQLHSGAETLRNQIERYNNYIKCILDQYTHISKNTEVRFKLGELVKKGVVVSAPLESHLRKITSFAISYLPVGLFQVMVLISGKQADVLMLNLADILEKVHNNISTLNYDNYLLNTKNTLELLERNLLRVK